MVLHRTLSDDLRGERMSEAVAERLLREPRTAEALERTFALLREIAARPGPAP